MSKIKVIQLGTLYLLDGNRMTAYLDDKGCVWYWDGEAHHWAKQALPEEPSQEDTL